MLARWLIPAIGPIRGLLPRSGSTGRQASFVVAGDGITFAALFVTSMILARTISKGDMGTYRQVTYLGPLVVGIVELGISSTVYRFFTFFKGEERQAFLWQAFLGLALLGALGALSLMGLAIPLSAAFKNDALKPALFIVGAYPLAVMPFMLVRPMLICKGWSLKATLWETAFGVATSLAMIIPLRAGWALNQALGLWMAANACRLPVTVWYVRSELRGFRPHPDSAIVREVWGYTWPLQLSRLPGLVMLYFDKVVTSLFLAREQFATYSLGARELPFLNGIPFSVSSVLVPRMVEAFQAGRVDRVCELWRKACLSTALLTFPFAVFAIGYAKPIVRALFTATYDESAIPFAVFAGITFLRVVDYGSIAKALGNSRIILRGSGIAALVSLPLSLALTYLWGVWGISFSLLLSNLVLVVFYLLSYRAAIGRPVVRFYPIWSLLGVAGLAAASFVSSDALVGHRLAIHDQTGLLPLAARLSAVLAISLALYGGGILASWRFLPRVFGKRALLGTNN